MSKLFTGDIGNIVEDYLIRHKVKELPVDVFELCRRDKITLVPYSAKEAHRMAELIGADGIMERTDGFAVQMDGEYLIFWDDRLPMSVQSAIVAHELGHIVLGHIGPSSYQYDQSDDKECQANAFAFNLLFPYAYTFAYQNTYRKENQLCV